MTKKDKTQTDWTPEPFPEPRTVPHGWHTEALEKKKNNNQESISEEWNPEPFPKPRTFPWNSGR